MRCCHPFLIVLLLCGLGCTVARRPSPSPPDPGQERGAAGWEAAQAERRRQLDEAETALAREDWSAARSAFQHAARGADEELRPDELRQWAECCRRLGQLDSARVLLESSVARDPGQWAGHRALAGVLRSLGAEGAARRELLKARDLNPDDWESSRELAELLRRGGSVEVSALALDSLLEELDRLVALRPQEAGWRQERERRRRSGDSGERRRALEALLARSPELPGPRLRLAALELETPGAAACRRALDWLEGVPAGQEDVRALELRGAALEGLERPAEALSVLGRAWELSPGRMGLPLRLGELSLALGDLRQAQRWALEIEGRPAQAQDGAWLRGRLYEAAVADCAGREATFDDKLVLEWAAREYAALDDGPLAEPARLRLKALEGRLPDAEDRYFNKYDFPRKECYKWLQEPSAWPRTTRLGN